MPDSKFAILASDAEANELARILEEEKVDWLKVDPEGLAQGVRDNRWAAAWIGDEQLDQKGMETVKQALATQPALSDFPILLLVDRQSLPDRGHLDELAQVRLIERPLDARLVSRAVSSALRSRQRQQQARLLMSERDDAQCQLQELTDSLETRVRERMVELRAANERLLREAEERSAAEERLRDSEELYRYTVELSQQMVWTADTDKRLISASPAFSALTGIPREVDANEAWLSVIHPDDLAALMERWNALDHFDQPRIAEFRMRVADGSYRMFRARAAPKLDEQGRVVRWYGYTEDIHEQKQAERARREAEERLRESEELHRWTLELSRQIVWTAAPDGTFLGRSRRYSELTGLPETSLPTDAIHPEDVDAMQAEWARCVAHGTPFSFDYRLRMRDGDYRFYRSRAAPRRDEAGNIVRWYGTSEDIHERRQAQQARIEAEERYQLAARATNDVIWDLNLVTNQIDWSDSASSFFGYDPKGPTPLSWWEERVHPDDRDRVSTSLGRVVRSQRTHWSESYRFRSADGSYVEIFDRGFIIRGPDGVATRAVGAMSDVTDRRHAEAQLQRMQAELIHVSRVSAMGTMASTLAHELNQPLTAVTSYVGGSRRLLQDIQDPTIVKVREALESAEAGAVRAGRIVRGLRELVARGNVSVQAEELSRLVRDASILAFVDAHLLGLSHRTELDPDAHWVDADRIQIQQVLINLIRNAVQAMADQPVREVVISARPVRRMVEISVADTGVGLSAEVLEALFSPFRSTKAEGMGIGLSISRTIVEAHGGKIWAENRPGGGAVFRFTLPRAAPPGSQEEEVQPEAAE